MKRFNLIFLIILLVLNNSLVVNANGNNNLGEVVRLSKQGLNYATASRRLAQRFSPPGSLQPAAFNISGIPIGAKIEQAFVWISTSGNGAPITVTVTNPKSVAASYPMSLIGSGADKCWGYPASLSYRANVTASITGDGKKDFNGTYLLSGMPTGSDRNGNDVDGATLMIIYTDPKSNYIGNLIINDGSVVRAPGTATQSITNINATSNSTFATAFIGVGDFQLSSNSYSMNGGSTFITTDWDFWNFYQKPTTIAKGQTTANFTVTSSGDCWNWSLMGIYYQTTELELIGLEVNQTIQDWDNSIPLIEKKSTFVRAFIQSNDATIKNLQPKLKLKKGALDSIYLTADNLTFRAPAKALTDQEIIDRRKDINKSLNFKLPANDAAKWLTGTIELSFEKGIDCKETASTPNDCSATITFNPSKAMDLKFYNSEWTDENGVKQVMPDAAFKTLVTKLQEEIKSFYPISKINTAYGKNNIGIYNLSGATPPNFPFRKLFIKNNSLLEALHFQNHPPEVINYYLGLAHLPGPNNLNPQGKAANGVASFHNQAIFSTVPHELGHLLGRDHVAGSPSCMAPAPVDNLFPSDNISLLKPSIGPMNMGVQKRIYGYNTQLKAIVDPEKNSELMSYCDPTWTSDYTYKKLSQAINSKFSTTARIAQTNNNITPIMNQTYLNTLATSDYRLIRGIIETDINNVIFDPIILLQTNTIPPLPPAGNYQLQFLDATNSILKTISFEPIPLIKEDPTEPNMASFVIPVLWDSRIKKVIVIRNNTPIAEKTASTNIPIVHVLYPNGGETFTGANTTFTWEANDIDGDPLTYGVQFSKDGGNTWETLDIDLTEKSYKANFDFLGATSSGLVRVLVSDGFNVASDESDGPFSTPNSAPEAYIVEPTNEEVFVREQPISFTGVARDLEDKSLPELSLSWSSNLDGFLGNGENVYKPANELSEGEHIIYFKVTDSYGNSAKDSIKIIVQRIASPGIVYYTKSSGDLHDLTTWGENPDGAGANPPDFGSGKTFQLANRTSVYTMTGNWSVGGIIRIQSGSQLQINGNTLSITNRIGTGTISGSPTSSLTVLASDDPFTLNLTSTSHSLNNLTVNSGASTVLGSQTDIYGVIAVNGTLNTGAPPVALLTFKSTATNTARLAPVTGTIAEGFARTEQYIPARRAWRMMNSPLSGTISIFNSWQESSNNSLPDPNPFPGYGTHITGGSIFGSVANGFDQNPGAATSIKRYNNATNAWVPLEQTISQSPHQPSMIFIRGDRGIALSNNAIPPTPTILRHTGQINVGNINSFVFASGFTVVRNPYQSPINFATLTRDNVQNNFYVWDPKMGGANGTGAYVLLSYNGTSYDIIPAAVSPESQNIQTGQSFMVTATNKNLPGSIIFKETDKTATPTMDVFRTNKDSRNVPISNAPVFSDPKGGQGLRINLQIVNGDTTSVVDEVLSSYKTTYSDKIDELDGVKMENMDENLGILREDKTLMVERKSLTRQNDTISLKLWNTSPKNYLLEFNPNNLSGTGLSAFLEDKYLNTSTPISINDNTRVQFRVNEDAGSSRVDRFQVVLIRKVPEVMAGLSDKSMVKAYPNPVNGRIINISFINKKKGDYQAILINNSGQVVFRKNIYHTGGSATQALQLDRKLSNGVYQLQIGNKEKAINITLLSNQ